MTSAVATPDRPHDRWRVRIPNHHGDLTDSAVHVDVDLAAERITVTLPDSTTATVDAVTARAVKDSLSAAIFTSLGAPGPWLHTERYDPTSATWRYPVR